MYESITDHFYLKIAGIFSGLGISHDLDRNTLQKDHQLCGPKGKTVAHGPDGPGVCCVEAGSQEGCGAGVHSRGESGCRSFPAAASPRQSRPVWQSVFAVPGNWPSSLGQVTIFRLYFLFVFGYMLPHTIR